LEEVVEQQGFIRWTVAEIVSFDLVANLFYWEAQLVTSGLLYLLLGSDLVNPEGAQHGIVHQAHHCERRPIQSALGKEPDGVVVFQGNIDVRPQQESLGVLRILVTME
jgi:hypothetical protein